MNIIGTFLRHRWPAAALLLAALVTFLSVGVAADPLSLVTFAPFLLLGFTRLEEMREVLPQWASGTQFSVHLAIPRGLLRGVAFLLSGTTVTDSALNDDAPWTLVQQLKIVLPLKRGDVTILTTGRDAHLLSKYLTRMQREAQTAATAGVTFSSFFLPFGPEPDWGIHSDAFRLGSEIEISGTWAPASEYGAATTNVTTGRLIPTLVSIPDAPAKADRMCLMPTTTRFSVESETIFRKRRCNKVELSEGLAMILFRQEDASAAGDRVDGLVTRGTVYHTGMGELSDLPFRELRQDGVEWAGIDPTTRDAALPLGLDGTALYVAAKALDSFPDLSRNDVELTIDSAETVPAGTTNVTPAAGDAFHATVVSMIRPGA